MDDSERTYGYSEDIYHGSRHGRDAEKSYEYGPEDRGGEAEGSELSPEEEAIHIEGPRRGARPVGRGRAVRLRAGGRQRRRRGGVVHVGPRAGGGPCRDGEGGRQAGARKALVRLWESKDFKDIRDSKDTPRTNHSDRVFLSLVSLKSLRSFRAS